MRTLRSRLPKLTGTLRDCSLFSGLPSRTLDALAGMSILRRYEDGENLFSGGDRALGFYIVADGRLKVFRVGTDGREQILHIFENGDICGEVPVFEGDAYPASAVAVGTLDALYLARRDFIALGRNHPEILLEMLAVLSVRLRRFVGLIDDLSLKEVSARLAGYLLRMQAESEKSTVELDTTKATLAAGLGTIAETLSRTLRKMQQAGVITVDGSTITITDAERLKSLADGEKL